MLRNKQIRNFRAKLDQSNRQIFSWHKRVTTQNQNHWLDIWLPRLSHLAQFGLFLFTIGSIYFTVLPLYQKALLEEAIAKKEVELANTTKILNKSYARIRLYAVREFYITAVPPCTGRFNTTRNTIKKDEITEKPKSRADLVYEIDIESCLQKMLTDTPALTELRPEDRKIFDNAVTSLGKDLIEKRKISMVQYNAAPSKITQAELMTLPKDSYRVQALEFNEKAINALTGRNTVSIVERRKLAGEIAQERIGVLYEQSIYKGIDALKHIEWVPLLEK
jgi:hypothetical protein